MTQWIPWPQVMSGACVVCAFASRYVVGTRLRSKRNPTTLASAATSTPVAWTSMFWDVGSVGMLGNVNTLKKGTLRDKFDKPLINPWI